MPNEPATPACLALGALRKLIDAVGQLATPVQPAGESAYAESVNWSDSWIDHW